MTRSFGATPGYLAICNRERAVYIDVRRPSLINGCVSSRVLTSRLAIRDGRWKKGIYYAVWSVALEIRDTTAVSHANENKIVCGTLEYVERITNEIYRELDI